MYLIHPDPPRIRSLTLRVIQALAAAACFTFTSCGACVPTYPAPRHCPTYTYNDMRRLESTVATMYASVVDQERQGVLVGFWSTEVVCRPEVYAHGAGRVSGYAASPYRVYVATHNLQGDQVPLCRTSYGHELIHAIRWQQTGDPDRDHTGPWWAPEVQRACPTTQTP